MSGQLVIAIGTTILLSVVFYLVRSRLTFLPPSREPVLPPPTSEAERLARLLVTEIRLYNFQEVDAVARHKVEPSEELCTEIAASRAMYRDRVSPGEEANHFEAAVLHILAAGDSTICARLLGHG